MDLMWAWCAFGLILLCIEMMTGTLYLLWLGIAALCLAGLVGANVVTSVAAQAISYAILAVIAVAACRVYEKKAKPAQRVGQAQGEEIGKIGTIISPVSPTQQGKIRFSQGVMGSKEWTAVSNSVLDIDQPATVVAVEGNSLRVVPA